ncbi:hypothetical protein [Streptomyces narbonensis]|uniref:hypothetical protein n=1 Tax=Streptomyces narbonensis TaxID=67333 RepID=UPI0033D05237
MSEQTNGNAWDLLNNIKRRAHNEGFCEYSAAHAWKGVLATTVINCDPLGPIPACDACAGFYERMQPKKDQPED